MTTPTRRISFYLKPTTVKSEQEACNYLDSLPASERSRAQRSAFLAGLALIKLNPSLAYGLAEWADFPSFNTGKSFEQSVQHSSQQEQHRKIGVSPIKENINMLFPE
ncbi:plasmid partitioning/stability family protein [Escherichia coli]|uniref:plasmid partitioning/stability family protein n=1 Tax=Escherichia coli TaxID=562 RepID=UPI00136FE567|nr:peptide transporter [Escherichia coli]